MKVLFYVMETEPMYYNHMMMNVLDLKEDGIDVRVVLESQAVKLPIELKDNEMFNKVKDAGVIDGICKGCAEVLDVYDELEEMGYTFLDDMMGHAGIKPYLKEGFEIVNM